MGSAWKIFPVTTRSLWSVLGGGGRESPLKHGAGGASTGGGGGGGRAGKDRAGGGAWAGKDRAGGSSTGALCTGFTLVIYKSKHGVRPSVRLCGQKLGSAWKILPVTARSLWSWWQTGQGGQGSRCGGPREVPFLLKKSLGKTEGPASNQTKIQFFKNIFSL